MYEFILILLLVTLALLSHLAKNNQRVEWIIRFIIFCFGLSEVGICFAIANSSDEKYMAFAYAIVALITILLLFKSFREYVSWLVTALQLIITGQILMPLIIKEVKAMEYFRTKRIFVPNSLPNLVALFVYITASVYILTSAKLKSLNLSFIPLPDPQTIQYILSCGGIAFILLALCGVGFYVTRSYKEVLGRLSFIKPSKLQISAGIFFIFFGFVYDAYWIIFTHSLQELATRLSYYDSNTFTIAGSFIPSVALALLTTTFAAVGEELLIRGALQPVFGILPSALLHGLVHSQLNPAPMFILQVAIWSIFMGLMKRYTNTTTTIISHAGFNILTVLLYFANP